MRKEHKSPTGGLTAKGRAYFKAKGHNLKAPVTGKVKRGSKAAKRRKSFCARMKGVKGAMPVSYTHLTLPTNREV